MVALYHKYYRFIELVLSRSVVNHYTCSLEDFFQRFPDKKYPDDIHHYDIEDWKAALAAEGRSIHSIDHRIKSMRAFFTWMKDRGYVTYNPVTVPNNYSPVPLEKRPLIEAEHLQALTPLDLKPKDKLLVLLPLTCGLRADDLAKVWGLHFDIEKGTLRVGKKTDNKVVPLRDDVWEEARKLGPASLYGGKPLYSSKDYLSYRLRIIATHAGINNLTITRLANTYDLHIQRAAIAPDADLEIVRSALAGIPRIS